ncbi:MAG: VirD4-like conjugal transfer protein, CD1115 family [[Clostridium] innocuum]|uniref:VirD4-like conjugal transfer protein, CD1115 family n=1 Tax=Clostridium innocuum TaxID=1522 RepID=UPI00056684E5|nr:type IV secretory system conjugative DNA transfer family protein [[Clostridium] innocuum]MCI2997172.1 type IV secretory system conjugative DNA transfer family protein [[Clostridium] innocuum]MCR0135882.1 type IV secretory system conjugative DNA transfer family protein [[Clostridium] innocuum]MCR0589147.1 type IV secretory system conjugative DNA transfer family protein [[Clostridium] innocuum]QIX10393.1 type IV secretory system conjugative DNA transfer family protein [[Clostridium] innocuum]
MSDKIRKYLLPNLPYLFVFWFFSKIGTAYRIAPGADFGTKLMGMLDTFPKAFETYWPGLGGIDLLVGLAGAAGVYLLIQSKIKQAKKFRRDAEYGTARWGTKEDIKPFVDPKFQNNVILTGTEFLTMNTRPKIPANARNLNACVIGSSGSGKTRFWLTPQLLQAHSSYVVVDPKGGTLDQCGRFLQREKYKVRVFNSIDFSKSMHYNPLAYIKTESDVLKFVTALIANTKGDGKEGDEFWTKAETLLYCALVAYIVFEGPEEERNMNTLVEMINSMEVREDDETFKNAVDYMFDGLERRSPQHFAVRQYKKYKLASGKTAKSILISCGARLAPFDIPQLREIMSYDELELDRLGDEKSALFFLISDTDTTYNFLVALAFSQMFNLLCERADNTYGGRLPHHVRVLWDEAANTGQVPGLEKIVAVIRSREISLTLFYQAMSQCKALYKDHSETIMGNMDSIVFLGGREASTLKDISENWLGKATISMQTEGRSRGQSESYSQNMQRLGRELMTTSEITTMPGDKCILQLRGLPPFFSPKYDLKKHPNYKYTAEFDKKKNAFHLESLFRHRPLRLKPEDEYTVYEVDGSDTDEEADLLNFDDLDSDEFV